MTREEAINILNDYDINFERNTAEEVAEAHEMAIEALGSQPSENELSENEKIAEAFDMAIKAIRTIPSENEQIIKISKGTLKARTGKYVIYDVEWLKTHFNTTEAKIYGQPQSEKRTEERTETHECDCISRKAVLDALHSYFAEGFNEDRWWNSTYVLDAITKAPSVAPQPKKEPQQKTGHWIEHKHGGIEHIECSKCKC